MPFAMLSTGATLQYEDVGQGELVLLLHGLLGTARVDLGEVIDALSANYRVLGITMRGYGASEPKPRSFPVDFYQRDAKDVLALMDALNIQQAHIGGYSDGGEVALLAATMQPERFKSVVVWGSIGVVPPELMPQNDNLGDIPGVDDLVKVARSLHGIDSPELVIAEWINAFTTIIQRGGDLSVSQAHRLTMPTLLMLGDADLMAPKPYAESFVAQAPNAQLKLFPGGHAVHKEHLTTFVHRLREFIESIKDERAEGDT